MKVSSGKSHRAFICGASRSQCPSPPLIAVASCLGVDSMAGDGGFQMYSSVVEARLLLIPFELIKEIKFNV